MNKILFTLTQVVLNPRRATPYSLFSGEELHPSYRNSGRLLVLPYLDVARVLVLYAVALIPSWILAAARGMLYGEVFAPLAVFIWGIGLLLGAIHLNLGLLVILALGLLSPLNGSLLGVDLWIPDRVWPLGLLVLCLPASFVLQAQARASKRPLYHWLQAALTLVVAVVGAVAVHGTDGLTAAYIWAIVALGALSLGGLTGIADDEASQPERLASAGLAIVVAGLAVIGTIGISWHVYALIWPPDEWTLWLRTVQVLFTALASLVVLGAAIWRLSSGQEQGRDFDWSWQLLFFTYVALSPSTPLLSSLSIALLALAFTALAFPTWDRFQKGSSLPGRIASIALSATICASLATLLVRGSSDHRVALIRLFLPDYPLDFDPYALFVVVGVLLSLSGLHWSALLATAGTIIGPLLVRADYIDARSALAIGAGLVLGGAVLGVTRVLLWPLLSLLTARQRNRVQQATGPESEACLAGVALADVYSVPLATRPLLAALAQKGVPAGAFWSDGTHRRYQTLHARRFAQAIDAADTLEEALQIDTAWLPQKKFQSGIDSLRAARDIPGAIARVRAFAAAIQELTAPPEPRAAAALPRIQPRLPSQIPIGTQTAAIGRPPTQPVNTSQPALGASRLTADVQPTYSLPELDHALESLKKLAYDDVRPAVAIYWETYTAFPDLASTGVTPGRWTADRREIQEGIEDCLSRLRDISKELSAIGPYTERLPREEQGHLREFEGMTSRLISIPREMDYQSRSRVIQESLSEIRKLHTDLESTWLTVARDEDRVVEHANPWSALADALGEPIAYLAQLNDGIFEWVTTQVVEALENIQHVDDLVSLTGDLERISGFGERYGPILDITIASLEAIGRDATAALAFPRGYSRRLGLQDALDQVNKLRGELSTRFLLEAKEITDGLERVAQILYDYLYAAPESEAGVYRNPYIAGNPINLDRAALFKGRLDLAQDIVALLRHRGNPTVVLYGPRRMGKTSFLLQLPRLLPSDYLPVFLDMQQGGAQQSDGSFTYALAYAIWRQLRSETSIQRPDLDEHERHPYTAMDAWLDEVQPLIGKRILFFTIDEFEAIGKAIEQKKLTVQVLEHLRSLMQHHENLLLMFAGVQTIEALGPDPASYFISAHPVEISYLHPREAEELIRNPDPRAGRMPDYDDVVVSGILTLTHRQPYLIQAICSEIIEMANVQQLTRIGMETLDEAAVKVLSTSLLFQNIWDDAEEEGQRLLTQLAAGPQPLDEIEIDEELLAGLLRRHVIREIADVYEIEIPLMRDWVRRQVG